MSDAKQETVEEIVESMRRGTKLPGFWRSCDLNKILEFHADRIEAAWKREKAEIEAAALSVGGIVEAAREREAVTDCNRLGNAAKMREALKEARRVLRKIYKPELSPLDGDNRLISATVGIINAALSAPARNCDLPLVVDGPASNNADKAWRVFKHSNPDAYFDVPGLLRCIDWLFATAAERKGATA